jgi:hypothetical protein
VQRDLELKLEYYGTSKELDKTRSLQLTPQVATLKSTSCRTI